MGHERICKLLEQSKVGPATTPDRTTLPLTFLDISLAGPIYVRRQFFYHFPYPTRHFMDTALPSLKRSLSIALQHFFPLAGNLLCPVPPHKPFIRCTSGHSVTLTVVESASDDFNYYSSNYPKNLRDLDCLVPKLSWSTVDEEDIDGAEDPTFVFPIVAFQVTVFPNVGLCISITYCHVMDDNCCSHFMKTWASICRSNGGDMTFLEKSPPSYDREVIKDPRGLEAVFLRDYFKDRSMWKDSLVSKTYKHFVNNDEELFKATIVFGKEDIEVLRNWAMYQWKKNDEPKAPKYLSKFVVTCGFVWTSLVKTRYGDGNEEEKDEYFRFGADCRNRLEYPLQENYFGNCITRCYASLKRKELKGEEGFIKAVREIHGAIEDMKKEPFKDAEKWKENFQKMFVLGSTVLVTGSPKFTVYETDFGFGRPKKVEMAHSFKCMSIAESGCEEGGGIELGLVFMRDEYEAFMSVVERGQQAFKS